MAPSTLRILKYAIRVGRDGDWLTYGRDQQNVQAVRRLVNLGLIERNPDKHSRTFRLVTDFTEAKLSAA